MVIVSCVLPIVDRFIEDRSIELLVFITYLVFVVIVVHREFSENRLGSFFGYKPKSAADPPAEPPDAARNST